MHLLAAAAERERKREILSDLCGRSEINVFGCGQLRGLDLRSLTPLDKTSVYSKEVAVANKSAHRLMFAQSTSIYGAS